MHIRSRGGKKNDRGADRIIEIKTEGWEKIKNDDILKILEHIFSNEDAIYPRPNFKGSGMFMDEIIKVYAKRINTQNDSLER